MILKDLCVVKVNLESADFYLVRVHNRDKIGKPVMEYSPSHIGIKIVRKDLLDAKYLFYALTHLYNCGAFAVVGVGTTGRVTLRVTDVQNIKIK